MNVSGTTVSATGHKGGLGDGLYDRAGARPDLDLDFARTKSLKNRVSKEDLITFTRSTSGLGNGSTYVDENGLVKKTPVNLIRNSQNISQEVTDGTIHKWRRYVDEDVNFAGTGIAPTLTITANYTTAPDGTKTAARCQFASGTQKNNISILEHRVSNTSNPSVPANTPVVLSVYLKSTSGSSQTINFSNTGRNRQILTVTGEWQRFEIKTDRENDDCRFRVGIRTGDDSGTFLNQPNSDGSYDNIERDILVWGAQCEYTDSTVSNGSVTGLATELIKTGSQASGAPRFTHDPVTLESKGLLIEQQATNLTYPSVPNQDGSGSGLWHGERTTRTYNAATAPDGTNTALLFTQDTTATTSHYVRANHMVTLTDNTDYTFSCFVKKPPTNGNRYVFIALHGRGYRHYDLQDGVLAFANDDGTASNLHGSITAYPNDWYKLTYTINTSSNNSVAGRVYIGHSANGNTHSFTGDGTSGLLVWGTQLEQGAIATSYIPTSATSTVTRSPDLASIEGDNFGTYRKNIVTNTSFRKASDGYFLTGVNANATYESYAGISPSGNYDALKMTATGSNSNDLHRILQFITLDNSSVYTATVYLKAGTADRAAFYLWDGDSNPIQAIINLTAETVTVNFGSNGSITDVGNGWYKISVTSLSTTVNGTPAVIVNVLNSAGASRYDANGESIFIWGLQVEKASAATEFIPSTDKFTSIDSNATFVDGNGIIRTAHKNLIPYSEEFGIDDTGSQHKWQNGNVQLSYDANHINPDGTAGTFYGNTYTGGNTQKEIYRYFDAASSNTDTLTFSLFCKRRDSNSQFIHFEAFVSVNDPTYGTDGLLQCCIFNPEDGTFHTASGPNDSVANASAPLVTDGANNGRIITNRTAIKYPNDWWRVSFTVQLNGNSNQSPVFTNSSRFDIQNLHQCYIWGAQVVKGTEAGDYHKTTGNQSGPPRYSHDPETLTPTGLYLEPAATNLVRYSQDFTQTGGNKWNLSSQGGNSATFTPNTTTAPDGTLTAGNVNFGDGNWGILFNNSSNVPAYLVDPTSTSLPTLTTEWKRYTMGTFTVPSDAGSTNIVLYALYKTNTGSLYQHTIPISVGSTYTYSAWLKEINNKIYVWGIQLELGSVATSYIKTANGTATRSADIFDSTATEVLDRANGTKPAFYTTDGISYFAAWQNLPNTTGGHLSIFNNNGGSFFRNSNNSVGFYSQYDGSTQNINFLTANDHTATGNTGNKAVYPNSTVDDPHKAAFRFKHNDFIIYADGIPGTPDPTTPTIKKSEKMFIGRNSTGETLNGTLSRIAVWKTGLTNNKLDRITS